MITIQLLEKTDTIDPEDWCRPLSIVSMSGGHSDYYSFRSEWGGGPENNAKWVKVKYILGKCWHGKTVEQIDRALGQYVKYEFVRGELPARSRLSLKDYNVTDHSKDTDEEYNDDISLY